LPAAASNLPYAPSPAWPTLATPAATYKRFAIRLRSFAVVAMWHSATTTQSKKTHILSWLFARDVVGVSAERERLAGRGPLRGFVGTVSEAVDLIGRYRDAGVQLLINSDYRNDFETHELFASDVMPHFA
jgi:hypothetical protein